MRRTLGTLVPLALAAVVLVACGSAVDDDVKANDPADTDTSSSSTPRDQPTSDGLDYEVVDLVSETAAGGTVSQTATPITDTRALTGFTTQFTSASFVASVTDAAAGRQVPDGVVTYAATVSIGCDVPPGVEVTAGEAGLLVTPRKVGDPLPECLAPVTTVAVIDVVDG